MDPTLDTRAHALAVAAQRPDLHLPTAEEWAAMDAAQEAHGREWLWRYLPLKAPLGWRIVARQADGLALIRQDGLRVIASGAVEADGLRWLHVSCSRPKGTPSYYDLKAVKRQFIGDDLFAYQVFAPPSQHVDLAEVLHLFACVDRPAYLPDFTRGFDII